MLFSLLLLIFGYYEVVFPKGLRAVNCHLKGDLTLPFLQKEGKAAKGYVLSFHKRRLQKEAEALSLSVTVSPLCGLPSFFLKHKSRVGAMLGVLLALTLCLLSERFIWEITVVGNETLADEEILMMLYEEGVYEGAYTKSIDTLAVANRMAEKSDKLAFAAINIVGNCVEAVVLEHREGEGVDRPSEPSNLTAKENGVIISAEVYSGVSHLKAGDTILKGELLISGVNELRNGTWHYQAAKGKIYAEVSREISITKDLFRYEKCYTGEEFSENEIIFFSFSKKLSKESGNLPLSCDRIEKKERVMLFGRIPLPIWYKTVSYRAFTLNEVSLSEEEAKDLLRKECFRKIADTPLLSYRESFFRENDSLKLTVTYRAIEDIAEECPLFTSP